MTRPFCENCSRTRLTADGQIRNCLFADQEADLRSLLRSGASDDEIIAVWQGEMWCKSAHHGVDNGSPSLDVVAVSQAPSPESNPDSPSPVVTMVGTATTIES